MEVLAAKDADGTVRTAFNTCQVCHGSRKAYFVEQGDEVVCQNCGNAFGREDVAVRISYDFLSGAESLFTRWKENGK